MPSVRGLVVVIVNVVVAAAFSVVVALPAHGAAPQQSYELRGGQWQQVPGATRPTTAATQAAPDDPRLNQLEATIDQRFYSAARSGLIHWLKSPANYGSPQRDRALYLMAQALYGYGDRIKAFYYLDELMDEYPESRLMYPALEMQYKIADRFLPNGERSGYKMRFLGMPILDAEDEAVEMLYRIQQRSPGSPLAEKALKRTADYFYSNGDYDLAADVYAAYERSYPRSPLIPEVKLKHAFANYAQFRGVRFDPTPMIDARTQLQEYIAQYPKLAQDQDIAALVERIDNTLARKMWVTADFFRRTGQPHAQVATLRQLVETYPNSPDADRARAIVSRAPVPGAAASSATAPSNRPATTSPAVLPLPAKR